MATKKKTSKLKKPSNDGILNSIKSLFDEQKKQIDERLIGMEKRSDERFSGIDQKFSGIDQRFDKVDKEINGVRTLVEQLDRKFTEAMIRSEMTSEHNLTIKEHKNRISTLEQESTAVKAAIKHLKEV